MMYPPGGFGGTAQRIIREETPETESNLPLKQAVIGALASDVLVLFLIGAALCAGPIAPFPIAALAIGLAWRLLVSKFGKGAAVGVSAGLFLASSWIAAAGRDLILPGLQALWTLGHWTTAPILAAPWWIWLLVSVLAVLSYAFPKGWRRRAAQAILVIGIAWWSVDGWRHEMRALSAPGRDMGIAVQALAVPLLLAAAPFALALAARNWIEVLVGSTWPPQYDKVSISQEGILGVVAPWLTRRFQNPQAPVARDSIDVTLVRPDAEAGKPVRQYTRFVRPHRRPDGLAEFAQATTEGLATFSEKGAGRKGAKGAMHYGYTREEWVLLREAFIDAHLADRKADGSAALNEDGERLMDMLAQRLSPPPPPGEGDEPPEPA